MKRRWSRRPSPGKSSRTAATTDFTMFNVPERVEKLGDLWKPLLSNRARFDLHAKSLKALPRIRRSSRWRRATRRVFPKARLDLRTKMGRLSLRGVSRWRRNRAAVEIGRNPDALLPRDRRRAIGRHGKRFVTDGELIIAGAAADFDALLQRIHPAQSRVHRLAEETPATYVLFDLLVEATANFSTARCASAAHSSRLSRARTFPRTRRSGSRRPPTTSNSRGAGFQEASRDWTV